ncbi:hypothetical protein KTT_33530 [Tengunoibacter tsumagoiensis]|uniref:Pectate lyase superfamily protein domain-containing protein n=2 Tax=Tengunoibacter tsumagoiensis TaxID=2014871 RepID=A0A402A2Y7_9CHLR|nr:hypothetical protein KTT_33530 [Tengunoibacter tsumagoiensis]
MVILFTMASCGSPPIPAPRPQTHISSPLAQNIQQQNQPLQQVIAYPPLPGALSSSIQLTVDGQPIFVEHYKDSNYARFAFAGRATIVIRTPQAEQYQISPHSYAIQTQKQAGALSFTLDQPRKLLLQMPNGTEKLFLFADAPETDAPNLGDPNVINISSYLTNTSGPQTAPIQRALDDASQRKAIVYFPDGKYVSGSLTIKSDTSIYLASGALLLSTGQIQDTRQQFLMFNGTQNARLYGRGAIDVQGLQLRRQNDNAGRVKILRTLNAKNITIEDLLLRDAGSWTVHLLASDTIHVTNLKIINDMNNTNGDGIDPDGSTNITIDGAFIYTTDDCFAVKASGLFQTTRPTDTVLIKNAVCYDRKSALKVGTETRHNISNVTFENNDIIHADRALALYMEDGSVMSNIIYLNNHAEVIGGDAKQRLIDFSISNRSGIGQIKNVQITNFTAAQFSPNPSVITGLGSSAITVTIQNLSIAGTTRTSAASAQIQVSNAMVNFQS